MTTAYERGQSLIETIVSLPLIAASILSFTALCVALVSSILSHHYLYEFLICSQQRPLQITCLSQAQSGLKRSLWAGQLIAIQTKSLPHEEKAVADVLLPWQFKLHIQESIQMPLEGER